MFLQKYIVKNLFENPEKLAFVIKNTSSHTRVEFLLLFLYIFLKIEKIWNKVRETELLYSI